MANNPKSITVVDYIKTKANLNTLAGGGSLTKGSDTLTADEDRVYLIDDDSVQSVSLGGGTPITPDASGNVDIPIANYNTAGIVKIRNSSFDSGLETDNQNRIYVRAASNNWIDSRGTNYATISPANLNYAVKAALSDTNHLTMTAQEQTTAQSVLGAEASGNKVTSLSSSSTDTEYPSAKCVYDLIGDIETLLGGI